MAPNPIDFDKVFSADLSKNFVVLTVICGIFGLYLVAAVFARRADKKDDALVRSSYISLCKAQLLSLALSDPLLYKWKTL